MTKTRKVEPKGLSEKVLTPFPTCELLGRVPSSLTWSPVPCLLEVSSPRGRPSGDAEAQWRGACVVILGERLQPVLHH